MSELFVHNQKGKPMKPINQIKTEAEAGAIKSMLTEEWIRCGSVLPPDGKVVETKLDDERGCRNVADLKLSCNSWYRPDGSMYVYYTPTHWRVKHRENVMTEEKCSPGAMRAADQIVESLLLAVYMHYGKPSSGLARSLDKMKRAVAKRINAETGLPELLEACKYTKTLLESGVGQATHALALIEVGLSKHEGTNYGNQKTTTARDHSRGDAN